MTAMPATETWPERAGPVFWEADSSTVPLPVAEWPDVTLSQGAAETAIHLQPVWVDTWMVMDEACTA